MLTLYYSPMSTSSVTEAVLAELEVDFQGVELNIDAGDTQSEWFLAINPNGRVPTIVHEGATLWESVAITLYLGEIFGVQKGLFPEQGIRRGEAMKWVAWANLSLADAAGRLAAELPPEAAGAVQRGSQDFVPPEQRRPEALTEAQAKMRRCLSVLNSALEEKDYILSSYSIVDTHMSILVAWTLSLDLDLSEYPSIGHWFERCMKRPAIASIVADNE